MEETGNIIHLSGAEDFLPITISERLLIDEPLTAGSMLCLEGQLRSYNKVIEGTGRLLITAFAQRILNCEEDEENPNRVQLTGALCKPPSYRTTPFGREIADLMLAVNRSYGKSDYIPCITWGRTARYAANLKIGDRVQLPDGTALNKVAYEVSVSRLSTVRDEPRRDFHTLPPQMQSPGALTGARDCQGARP